MCGRDCYDTCGLLTTVDGRPLNSLFDPSPQAIGGGPRFHSTPVTIEPAEEHLP